ncbi:hypothetical protein GQ457_03G027870 [Hibiscus cannabinus]
MRMVFRYLVLQEVSGSYSVLFVELWAIHDVFFHAWSLGFRRVELDTDNLEASRIVTGISRALVDHSLVGAICTQLSLNWEVEICHIGRTANGVADSLANLARGKSVGSITFVECLIEAVMTFSKDNLSL